MARRHKARNQHGGANPRRRFWPSGIAGRLTLVFVGVMIIAVWTSAGLYVRDRAQTTFKLLSNSVADRVGVIVPLLEKTPPQVRDTLLLALNSPTLWIGITDVRHQRITRGWRPDREHDTAFQAVLPYIAVRTTTIHLSNPREAGAQPMQRMRRAGPARRGR